MADESALTTLRRLLPEAARGLHLDLEPGLSAWEEALDRKVLPRMAPDFPLVAAICGGGSAGKSTLFNSIVGQGVSPTGGRAGLNRRVLVALNSRYLASEDLMAALGHAFKEAWQPLAHSDQLTTTGDPLYWSDAGVPSHVVLLDTPDIDTGAAGQYANREAARQSLEAADLLVYIFTNATYNNRDNTDFVAGLLTAVGTRPCFLVYRVYPSFSDDEVGAHARTVACNLYGDAYTNYILGVFRADEDNAVAAGEKVLKVQALGDPDADLSAALAALDTAALRRKVMASVYDDILDQAGEMITRLGQDTIALKTYLDLLAESQRRCVQRALSHFPTDRVLGRFAEIWLAGDPAHIKWMRRTGRVVEWPYKMLFKVLGRGRDTQTSLPAAIPAEQLDRQLEIDLLDAAGQLYRTVLDSGVQGAGQAIGAPAAVAEIQARLRARDWQAVLDRIAAQKEMLLSWSDQLEKELKALADGLRSRMGFFDQVRQTFAALLNVLPATAAVTYILHTGDPVGAAGIKVKLTGLFGLQDLYALIAIPVTSGMKRADRLQLEGMLAPVAGAWLADKLQAVERLFETHISGELTGHAAEVLQRTTVAIDRLEQALTACKEAD